MARKLIFFSILITVAFLLSKTVLATEFTSGSFKVIDPVINIGGISGATSSSFQESGGLSQIAIGTSSSANFNLKSGFFYFPQASVAAVQAAAEVAAGNFSSYLESLAKSLPVQLPIKKIKPCNIAFDFNCDNKVNVKDFSIFLASETKPALNPKAFSVFLSTWTEKFTPFVFKTAPSEISGGISKIFNLGKAAKSLLLTKPSAKVPEKTAAATGTSEYKKPNFIKNVVRVISNIFSGIIKLFKK